jgi:hypothetical protein
MWAEETPGKRTFAMIGRRWHGRVPADKARKYLQLMTDVGLADYRSTPGNRAAMCLHRRDGDVVHVEMFTLWNDEAAIRRFAGDNMLRAKYYDFDPDYLIELEPEVLQFEVIEN